MACFRTQFRLRTLFIVTAIVAVGCLVGRSKMPDGQIIRVGQTSGAVWINIGQADGLRRKANFGVVGAEKTVRRFTPTKGHIEVVKLLGPHFAECRILDRDVTDPMVPGDRIFTPTW